MVAGGAGKGSQKGHAMRESASRTIAKRSRQSRRCGKAACMLTRRARPFLPPQRMYSMRQRALLPRWRCSLRQPRVLRLEATRWLMQLKLSRSPSKRAPVHCWIFSAKAAAAVTDGVPAELLKRKQDNLDRQQEIAELLTGINISTDEPKKKPGELEAELDKLQTEFNEIENQIRVASPRYAALTSGQSLSLADVSRRFLMIRQSCSSTAWDPKPLISGR